jgi:peroxiredoxin Q/BCP
MFAIVLAALSVGNRAPDFELRGSDGKLYRLNDLLAEGGGIVLAWFPKAFTPG